MPAKKQNRVRVVCPRCGHAQEEPQAAYSTTCKACGRYYKVQEALRPAPPPKERARDLVRVTCPKCNHTQEEPRAAYSTVCKQCQHHYRIQDVLEPRTKAPERPRDVRRVTCFQCGTELEVASAAKSTMCKRCSGFVDLSDYRIDHSVTKNFRTKGRFVIEEKGFVFNTDSIVGEAVIRGKFYGKLAVERSLEIHSSADIRGSFTTPRLIIPAGQQFRWDEALLVGGAEIGGELVADIRSAGTIALKAGARLFGNVEARNFLVESGAVFVGAARIGETPRG